MGDHFVLMVDRLLTQSTLEAVNQNRIVEINGLDVEAEVEMVEAVHERKGSCDDGNIGGEIVECRICQEEEVDRNMESPCSCSGSLKYAHRKCVQRWCNEKGDTTCEICLQPFEPGYTSPPKLFHYGRAPLNFRGNWEISRQDLNNPRFMAMFARTGGNLDGDFDGYNPPREKGLLLCRIVAAMFVALLILRHALPVILNEDEYSLEEFSLLAMRIAGILFPVYVIIQTLSILYLRCRHNQQGVADRELPVASSQGENGQPNSSQRTWWQQHLTAII